MGRNSAPMSCSTPRRLLQIAAALWILLSSGCAAKHALGQAGDVPAGEAARVQPVRLASPGTALTPEGPVVLGAAKNESTNFTVQVSGLPLSFGKAKYSLRLSSLKLAGAGESIANT